MVFGGGLLDPTRIGYKHLQKAAGKKGDKWEKRGGEETSSLWGGETSQKREGRKKPKGPYWVRAKRGKNGEG